MPTLDDDEAVVMGGTPGCVPVSAEYRGLSTSLRFGRDDRFCSEDSDSERSLKTVHITRRSQREVSLAPHGVLPPRDS